VVAVAVGVLSSSQLPIGDGRGSASPTPFTAFVPSPNDVASATSIPISQKVHWITRTEDGKYSYTTMDVREVGPHQPDGSQDNGCSAGAPPQDQPVGITEDPQTVFGSNDGKSLIVVGAGASGSSNSVAVVPLQSAASPAPSSAPSGAPATARPAPA